MQMQQLVQQLVAKKPHLQPLIESLQSQGEEKEAIMRVDRKLIEKNKRLLENLKHSHAETKRLTKAIQQVESDLDFFMEINDELALALGACTECWGEVPGCEHCNGEGRPGAFAIDQKAFEQWIAPVLTQLKRKTKSQTPSAGATSAPAPRDP